MTDQEKDWNPREEWESIKLTADTWQTRKILESLLTAYEDRGKEIERLTECLKIANEQTEEYERRYYLKMNDIDKYMDENEALRARVSDLEIFKSEYERIIKDRGDMLDRLREENDVRNYELMEANEERDHLRAMVGEL